jgi:hypothetical protein
MEKVNIEMGRPFFRADVGEAAGGFAAGLIKGLAGGG